VINVTGHVIAPNEVMIQYKTESDSFIKRQINNSILKGNRDGDRIICSDRMAAEMSNTVGYLQQHAIERMVTASNHDQVDDLTVRTIPVAQGCEIGSQKKEKAQSGHDRKGYQIPEYTSMYESNNTASTGYQTQEYKSIYD
jgi:hypothetical protein